MNGNNTRFRRSSTPLQVHFLEPSSDLTREHFINAKLKKLKEGTYQQIYTQEIKERLKSVREENIASIGENVKDLLNLLEDQGIPSFYAETAKDAAKYIEDVLHESKLNTLCINNSTSVRETLSDIGEDIEIVDTYNAEYIETEDIVPLNYWELPEISDDQVWNAFDVSSYKCKEPYSFVALLGANAVCSKDGSIFFVQHFKNITNVMEFAHKTILVISIEKIVKNHEQALFISKSAGFFGFKSVLLGILSNATKYQKISMDQIATEFEKVSNSNVSDIHVILLDNGRMDLLVSEFEEFLQCINCKACGAVCPRSLFGYKEEFRTPRDLVLLRFTRGLNATVDQGLYNCSLCGGCEKACPLSIPLPDFLLKIREQVVKNGLVPKKHMTLGENVKNFGNPYGKGD